MHCLLLCVDSPTVYVEIHANLTYVTMGETLCRSSPALAHAQIYTCVYDVCLFPVCACVLTVLCSAGTHEEENTLYLPPLPSSRSLPPDLLQCVCGECVCVCSGVCLVLPEGCSGDVMNHLNEGQGV